MDHAPAPLKTWYHGAMRAVLIATYELGRQPFSLASPAAWLRRAGAEVICLDTAVAPLDRASVVGATLIGLSVPMHTATRLAAEMLPELRALAPRALIVCYGLYAPLNADHLRALGADVCIGGEYEAELVRLWERRLDGGEPEGAVRIALDRLAFVPPEREGLPGLERYARLMTPLGPRLAGYTEASRGCKHRCRHCPIVPVYGGRFRVVPREVVLEDARRQVAAGARHITFGDPDFLNGPGHVLPLVRALHAEYPGLTYDVTVKVEHLLRYAHLLPELRATGCTLVTSAVEALDDAILERFDKRHSVADVARAAALLRAAGIALNATFVAFTPWTSRQVYRSFLAQIAELGLLESVSPVQYAIRLLVPAGSRLLDLDEVRACAGPFDARALVHPWRHPDPAMDELQRAVLRLAQGSAARGETRPAFYRRVLALVDAHIGAAPVVAPEHLLQRPPIPYLSEPWYC
ncbi:MAG: CUAEP/CCAEP-tail radical SAM protein [Chloroflexi bacterium OHK40]